MNILKVGYSNNRQMFSKKQDLLKTYLVLTQGFINVFWIKSIRETIGCHMSMLICLHDGQKLVGQGNIEITRGYQFNPHYPF